MRNHFQMPCSCTSYRGMWETTFSRTWALTKPVTSISALVRNCWQTETNANQLLQYSHHICCFHQISFNTKQSMHMKHQGPLPLLQEHDLWLVKPPRCETQLGPHLVQVVEQIKILRQWTTKIHRRILPDLIDSQEMQPKLECKHGDRCAMHNKCLVWIYRCLPNPVLVKRTGQI